MHARTIRFSLWRLKEAWSKREWIMCCSRRCPFVLLTRRRALITYHRFEILANAFDHFGGVSWLHVVIVVEADHKCLRGLGNNDPGGSLPAPKHDAWLAIDNDVVLVSELCAALRVGYLTCKARGIRWVELRSAHI